MKVIIRSYGNDDPAAPPDLLGEVSIAAGSLVFSNDITRELCEEVALDAAGPVPVTEPERFLRALPACLCGSRIRAELILE
jgi:hypothetical protein